MTGLGPLLYAELLPHIRQVSVVAALPGLCDSSTRAELSSDGLRLRVEHDGHAQELALPRQVAYRDLAVNQTSNKELSFRLPLADQRVQVGNDADTADPAPWSAKHISRDDEFCCRGCTSTIVKREVITQWKDLPSEGWAEMMDLWYCHKPVVPADESSESTATRAGAEPLVNTGQDADSSAISKGYGANTSFSSQHTVGFVNDTSFLLAEEDLSNITVSTLCLLYIWTLAIGVSRRWPFHAVVANSMARSPIQVPKIKSVSDA